MYMEAHDCTPAARLSSMVEHYRACYKDIDHVFVETGHSEGERSDHIRWEIAAQAGEGFSELIHLNSGLNVGLCGYRLSDGLDTCFHESKSTLQFCMLLSGSFEFGLGSGGSLGNVRSGQLFFCRGARENMRYVQPSNSFISGLSVEVSHCMMEAWLNEASCDLSRALEKYMRRCPSSIGVAVGHPRSGAHHVPGNHPLTEAARALYATRRDTVCGKLQFESLALDFLSRVLSLGQPFKVSSGNQTHRQRAVDEAMGILNDEWATPPTICSLARRVGINECYLKTDFRTRTGFTIGEYVRKLRMENALSLIESGRCSILQAATFVGYSNPSHFSEAFKRFHGRLPSAYMSGR